MSESAPQPWTWLYDDYGRGTVFITDDPKEGQRPIAEGLDWSVAARITDEHNLALIRYAVYATALISRRPSGGTDE